MQVASLFEETLKLSPVDKVKLIDFLVGSFSTDKTKEHELAWADYAERICSEIDAGAEVFGLEEVINELNQ